jgi:hypothetical protein
MQRIWVCIVRFCVGGRKLWKQPIIAYALASNAAEGVDNIVQRHAVAAVTTATRVQRTIPEAIIGIKSNQQTLETNFDGREWELAHGLERISSI